MTTTFRSYPEVSPLLVSYIANTECCMYLYTPRCGAHKYVRTIDAEGIGKYHTDYGIGGLEMLSSIRAIKDGHPCCEPGTE